MVVPAPLPQANISHLHPRPPHSTCSAHEKMFNPRSLYPHLPSQAPFARGETRSAQGDCSVGGPFASLWVLYGVHRAGYKEHADEPAGTDKTEGEPFKRRVYSYNRVRDVKKQVLLYDVQRAECLTCTVACPSIAFSTFCVCHVVMCGGSHVVSHPTRDCDEDFQSTRRARGWA